MTVETDYTDGIYAAPPDQVPELGECAFYHTMEIPGHGLIRGDWDLRRHVKSYLGNVDFSRKRVLDLGTADGYLTFHIERSGGEVVSYDITSADQLDTVPFARLRCNSGAPESAMAALVPKMNNAYWFCHNAFNSAARLVHGDIYSVPEEIGAVDISVFGSILLHTGDPFRAMIPAVELTRETVIVTDGLGLLHLPAPIRWVRRGLPGQLQRPVMRFVPDWRVSEGAHGWWRLTPEVVQAFLGVLGFERSEVSMHSASFNGRRRKLFTVVGHRTVGTPVRVPTISQQSVNPT